MNDVQNIAQYLSDKAETIRSLYNKTCENILEMGKHLTEVKDTIGHGKFLSWLGDEFDWSERKAQDYIRIYKTFGSSEEEIRLENFSVRALRRLSSTSTPVSVREEMIERANVGESIGETEVKEAIVSEEAKTGPRPVLGVKEEHPEESFRHNSAINAPGADLGAKEEEHLEPEVLPPETSTPEGIGETKVKEAIASEEAKTEPRPVLGVNGEHSGPAVITPKRREPVFTLDDPEVANLKDITPPSISTKVESEVPKEPETLEASLIPPEPTAVAEISPELSTKEPVKEPRVLPSPRPSVSFTFEPDVGPMLKDKTPESQPTPPRIEPDEPEPEIVTLRREIAEAEEIIDDQNKTIADLRSKIILSEAKIRDLMKRVEELLKENAELSNELFKRDALVQKP